MSSLCILVLVALGGAVGHAGSFIELHGSLEVNAQYGQTSVLECIISTSEEVEDPEITWLSWSKDGADEPLLLYARGSLKRQPGYSMASASWKTDKKVSLHIASTTLQHEGEYSCDVAVNNIVGQAKKSRLRVTAQYGTPTIISTPENIINSDGVLECHASGGYPEGRIRWFDENRKEKDAEMLATPIDGGLFHLSSRLTLWKGSMSSKYTCTVINASGRREEEATYEIVGKVEGQTSPIASQDPIYKIVTPLVVIGSCIVGLLLALLLCRRRSRLRQNLHHQRYEAAEEGEVSEEDRETPDEEHHGT